MESFLELMYLIITYMNYIKNIDCKKGKIQGINYFLSKNFTIISTDFSYKNTEYIFSF